MSDLEKMEIAIRNVLAHLRNQHHDTGVETMLQLLADEMATFSRTDRE